MTLKAVIWDFDGTIADSNQKNYAITKELLGQGMGLDIGLISALDSYDDYTTALNRYSNWRSLYAEGFGIASERIDEAGDLWHDYQVKMQVRTPVFPGLRSVFDRIHPVPQAIVSQNSKDNIQNCLIDEQCDHYFSKIIGYQDVPYSAQKPDPTGLVLAMKELLGSGMSEDGIVIYVGDHATDLETAQNAQEWAQSEQLSLKVHGFRVGFERTADKDAAHCTEPAQLEQLIAECAGL